MRKGKTADLQPRDLDFVARTIKVRVEVAKTNRGRVIPMAEAIRPLCSKMRAEGLARDGYIFGEGSGFRRIWVGESRLTDCARTCLKATHGPCMTLSAAVATRLHDAGVDTLVVEDVLGHLGGAH